MKKKHKHQHLFPVFSFMFVIIGIVLISSARFNFTPSTITAVILVSFLANLSYGLYKKQLTTKKIIELGLLSLLLQLVAIAYL